MHKHYYRLSKVSKIFGYSQYEFTCVGWFCSSKYYCDSRMLWRK